MHATEIGSANVIVIGGGIVGCSIAYHLTQLGVSDVVLLERKKLTSGTTWHAAGLVAQLRASQNMTRLSRYSTELFAELAKHTGQETGYQQTGSMTLALHAERLEELKRQATMANAFGVHCELIDAAFVHEQWPGIQTEDLCGGVYLPGDGQTNPVDTTLALAKGARQGGAQIFEDTKVARLAIENGQAVGVYLDDGTLIAAKQVVLAGGMWSREFAAQHDIHLPLQAAEQGRGARLVWVERAEAELARGLEAPRVHAAVGGNRRGVILAARDVRNGRRLERRDGHRRLAVLRVAKAELVVLGGAADVQHAARRPGRGGEAAHGSLRAGGLRCSAEHHSLFSTRRILSRFAVHS